MTTDDEKQPLTTIAQLVAASDDSMRNNHSAESEKNLQNVAVHNKSPEAVNLTHVKNDGLAAEVNGKKSVAIMDRLLAGDMLVPGSNIGREIQDDYRRIKRPLVSNACGRNKALLKRGNIILVTSSIPGEGKTYSSTNLALSISREVDSTVLLVDCDVARHGVSRLLGINGLPGLVDVLENDTLHIGDVILQTDVPNLRVVSAGKQHEDVTELLASQRMSNLVDELANRYSDRIVIFDGPPMLPTPQTQILAGLVGQVVFIIEVGKTPQAMVEDALKLIPEDQATGLVLNKNEGLSVKGYYYGYYGPDDA